MSSDVNEQESSSPMSSGAVTAQGAGKLWSILSIPHLLSLDAPIIAVVWAHLFADSLNVPRLFPGVYAMLFCSVWCIYLVDRLLDTGSWQEKISQTARHRFVRRHWWKVLLLTTVPALWVVWLGVGDAMGGTYGVPSGIIAGGFVLLLLVMVYFVVRLTSHRYMNAVAVAFLGILLGAAVARVVLLPVFLWCLYIALLSIFCVCCVFSKSPSARMLPRELLCGVVFAIGTVMPVYWHVSDSILFAIPLEIVFSGSLLINVDTFLFAALCVLNCIGISIWEKVADADGNDPQAVAQYAPQIEQSFPMLAVSLMVVAIGLLWDGSYNFSDTWKIKVCVALSAGSLLAIHSSRDRLHPLVSRVIADAVLLWPLIFLAL